METTNFLMEGLSSTLGSILYQFATGIKDVWPDAQCVIFEILYKYDFLYVK